MANLHGMMKITSIKNIADDVYEMILDVYKRQER